MNNKIIREIYQNGQLVNTFTNQYDNIKNILDDFYVSKFINKTFKIKEKTHNTNTMELITTWWYYDCDMRKECFKAVYKNVPCKGNRLDTDKLLDMIKHES